MSDLRFAFRQLLKQPGFTATAVLTLALGIGVCTAMFSVFHAVVLRQLPYPQPDRLVMLWERNPERGFEEEMVSPLNVLDWERENEVFEGVGIISNAGSTSRNFLLRFGDTTERLRGRLVSSGFFNVFNVGPLLGRTFLPEENQPGGNRTAVLSYDLWQRRFGGDPSILGQTLDLEEPHTIVGVMPPGFRFPQDAELWLSFGQDRFAAMTRRDPHYYFVVARLKPEVSLGQAEAEMSSIQRRIAQAHPDVRMGTQVKIVPLLEQLIGAQTRRSLWLLTGAVGLVLFIACVNIANLLLARGADRCRELAIRAAFGASRSRLARQLLTESVALALIGGLLGVAFAFWGLRAINALGLDRVPSVVEFRSDRLQEVRLNSNVLGFSLTLSVITGLFFGLVPAIQGSKLDLNEALKDGKVAGLGRERLRHGLIVAETAMASLLLGGAGLLLHSFARLQQVDPGLHPHHLLVAEIDLAVGHDAFTGDNAAVFQAIADQVRALPGVTAAGGINTLPLIRGGWIEPFVIEGREQVPASALPTADLRVVTPDFFRAAGIQILQGRDVREQDSGEAPRVALINAQLARRLFPNEDPVGKRVSLRGPGDWREIIGVVADVKHDGLEGAVPNNLYLPYRQIYFGGPEIGPSLLVRTQSDPATFIQAVRQAFDRRFSRKPVVARVQTMNQILSQTVTQARFRTWLLSFFGLASLLLTAVGIYGVISYSVSQRTREIGIRMALGARRGDVLQLVARKGLGSVLAGLGLGIGAALGLGQLLRSLLYQVSPTDPATFVSVALVLLSVAGIACLIPARRATRVDPMVALRHE